ncbi:MAG: ribosome maturation factor RimP [Desulfobacterales bacterium]|nr:ribosome maturation factor RimP [Desulfobacterales bacterium]
MDEQTQKFIADVELLAETLLKFEAITLIDVEYRRERNGWTLRLIIDKDGGVTLKDCADISNQLGDILNAKTDFQGPYHLEISSPGLTRPLRKPKHFIHFQGRQALIKTSRPVEGKSDFKGTLSGFSDGVVRLLVEQQIVSIPYESIAEARLDY